jgi:hypothetical protein
MIPNWFIKPTVVSAAVPELRLMFGNKHPERLVWKWPPVAFCNTRKIS